MCIIIGLHTAFFFISALSLQSVNDGSIWILIFLMPAVAFAGVTPPEKQTSSPRGCWKAKLSQTHGYRQTGEMKSLRHSEGGAEQAKGRCMKRANEDLCLCSWLISSSIQTHTHFQPGNDHYFLFFNQIWLKPQKPAF